MATSYILYNLKAGSNTVEDDIYSLEIVLRDESKFIDISRIKDYKVFLSGLETDDCIVLCGGDGTLNRFINDTDGIEYNNAVYYYPLGTGNDFANDMGHTKGCKPFEITQQIKNLPTVTVKNKTYRFLNGVGYGIDGYCCEVGDELKMTSTKPVNYTNIAIKGLLFDYKPTNAKITVDGVSHSFEKVWLAPTMNGRYYGGGMMPTPEQNRQNKENSVSLMVLYGSGKLKTLTVFPSIFKGEHIKHTEMVEVYTGHNITVEFDRPVALQIDGETILNVKQYSVSSGASDSAENVAKTQANISQ